MIIPPPLRLSLSNHLICNSLYPSPTPSSSHLIESTDSQSANDNTTSALPKPVGPSRLQPSPSPSPPRLIESTETIFSPNSTCTPCITLTSPNFYCKRLSIDLNSAALIPLDDDLVTDVFSDDASDTNDCELFDEITCYEDDLSDTQPRKEPVLEETTLDMLIAQMTALTLNNPPRPSKLRQLILVTNRRTTSTSIPYSPLLEPTYPMGAFTRSMQARSLSDSRSTDAGIALPELGCPVDALTRSMDVLSLGDLPSSTSTLKPLTWLRSATLDTSSSHLPQLPCFDSLSLKRQRGT
ncbi:hypothetical protein EDB19DRAFT_733976 [Suillus lakei]|nr:hypothetical protein EDB19DRAFT_733976 [Suillus lakei]